MKIIFVTGGVLSGLGKGVAASSIGHLLSHQYKVVPVKCDGYLNTDPGTMNPVEHGEVFVLEDGGEVDMDFGHYERFLRVQCKSSWSLTMGKVFLRIMERERRGDFLGKTVQMIPHVVNEIKSWLLSIAKEEQADVLMVEIGGTIGDIENEMYVEAARELALTLGRENVLFAHLTYVPLLAAVHEQKSKPSQQSVMLLRQRGINPDIILARTEQPLSEDVKAKIALFSNLQPTQVISVPDVPDVYELPHILQEQNILQVINDQLKLKATHEHCAWHELLYNLKHATHEVTVAIAGKYTKLGDSYASIMEALKHSAANTKTLVSIRWVETSAINSYADVEKQLAGVDAVIVPGGFGNRGIEGKIQVIQYCREKDIPFLGICYGMQLAVVEFARNVCGLAEANTTEVNTSTPYPIIDFLPEQVNVTHKGGTMRLGGYQADITHYSQIYALYGQHASERHRHRYEVNPEYHEMLAKQGLLFSGTSRNGLVAEFMELPGKQYFVGTQAHPELKSSLETPAPLFMGLVRAAREKKKNISIPHSFSRNEQ
jgi:CTP synthase